jgi:DNA polymerase I-like protein with 3'-5' exonuclease and polymerase domains
MQKTTEQKTSENTYFIGFYQTIPQDPTVYKSHLSLPALKDYLQHFPWTSEDHWWETMPLYRMGITLPDAVVDVSLQCYALDSGMVEKDLFAMVQLEDKTLVGYDELTKVLSPEELSITHCTMLETLVAKKPSPNAYYFDVERPLVAILAEMEREGIKVDTSLLASINHEIHETLGLYQREINQASGRTINILSPKQLREWIYDDLKAVPTDKTDGGKWSTSEAALESLTDTFPVLQKVLDFRMLSKMRSTYCEGLTHQADPFTHRVHTHFDQKGTITGRLSSSEPNVQNIPIRSTLGKRIRASLIAEEGKILISADYSQIELRLMAHFSEDPNMVYAMKHDIDIHRQTASNLYEVPLAEVSEAKRRDA